MKLLSGLIAAVTLAASPLPVPAANSQTEYVLPDPPYVQSECKRLALEYSKVQSLVGAHGEVAAACSQYKGDGDAWFAQIKDARDEIDGYDPHPELHDYQALTPSQVVPRKANAPYVLFLAPDYGWVKANRSNLTDLHGAFVNFGHAIGGDGLAIWFTQNGDPATIDVARSARYCAQNFHFGSHFGLSINSGPYVVITGTRPDQWTTANDVVILKLSGLTQRQIISLLNELEQQLLEGRKVDEGRLLFTEVEYRLTTLAQQHANVLHAMVMFIFKGPAAITPGT
ncbi:MAG: hypothetical protein WB615_16325 [Candidatus Tumulicola sp.]